MKKITKQLFLVVSLVVTLLVSVASYSTACAQERLSVLILGTDTGALGRTDHGRSDAVLILTVNSADESLQLISIPRDTYVPIVGKGFNDKINHAYAFGGVEMSKATVEQWLGIELQHYVVVDMQATQDIVDAVGGIDVVPPTSFEIGGHSFTAGETMHLNGEQALMYSRERYTSGGDYARQERQREVIQQLLLKAQSLDNLANFQSVYQALSKNMQTDMSFATILELFGKYHQFAEKLSVYQISGNGQMIDGVYYDVPDEDSVAEAIRLIKGE